MILRKLSGTTDVLADQNLVEILRPYDNRQSALVILENVLNVTIID